MNSLLSQARVFPSRTNALSGGKAPAHWKRELSRETNRLVMVLRTCGWIKAVAEVQPSLLDQPLLGNCLAEIVGRDVSQPDEATTETPHTKRPLNSTFGSRGRKLIEGTTDSASHTSRTRRPGVLSAANVSEGGQIMDQPAETLHSRSPGDRPMTTQRQKQSEAIFQLPAQAGALLLNRLAGSPVDISKQQASPANRLSSSPRNGSASSTPPLMSSLGATKTWLRDWSSPGVFPASLDVPVKTPGPMMSSLEQQQDWRRLVADRATKTWLRDWSSPGVFPASLDVPVKTPGPNVSTSPLLAAHWTTFPSGQRATPEILRRLAQQPGVSEMTRSKVDSPGNKNSFPSLSPLSGQASSTANRELRGEEVSFGAKPFAGILRGRDRSLIQETDPTLHAHSELDAHAGEYLRSERRFAPPSLAPSLPQLLPPVGPGTASLPIAAETARYGAWHDEVNAQKKDLSLLAEQVKQILDEEARRHGIDV